MRADGWTLHPNDVVGRVWVVRADQATGGFRVFTTICPHLGCSVNLAGSHFACPCHNAAVRAHAGEYAPGHENPAQRGMDELEWQRDPTDPERLLVRYQNFKASESAKIPIG